MEKIKFKVEKDIELIVDFEDFIKDHFNDLNNGEINKDEIGQLVSSCLDLYDTINKQYDFYIMQVLTSIFSIKYLSNDIGPDIGALYNYIRNITYLKNDINFYYSSIDFKKEKIINVIEKLKNSPWNNGDFTDEVINDLSDIDKFLSINIRLHEFKEYCTDINRDRIFLNKLNIYMEEFLYD